MSNQQAKQISRIPLENERTNGIEKKVNQLGAWKFFKVLYSNDMFKIMGLNLIMLALAIPAILLLVNYNSTIATWGVVLPFGNTLGIGYAPWLEVDAFAIIKMNEAADFMYLLLIPALAILSIAIAGGFACVRDSFYTGKLKVFKTFFIGVYNTALPTFLGTSVLSALIYGIHMLQYPLAALPQWAGIVLTILAWIVFVIIAIYLFTFFSVISVHKQSYLASIKASFKLMFMNIIPNIFRFIITFTPLILMLNLTGIFATLMISLFLMFGMFYMVFVWQVHMMKTFALFHPVARKKVAKTA